MRLAALKSFEFADIICFYFRRADFLDLGRELGLATELKDIHALNPYFGYRFNALFSKPD